MSDLVEKVARAICIADGESDPDRMLQLDPPNVAWSFYTDDARAAIAAVAEWLDTQGDEQWYPGERLREQLDGTK